MNRTIAGFAMTSFLGAATIQAHPHNVYVQEVYPTQVVLVNEPPPGLVRVANDDSPIVVNEAPPAPLIEEIQSPGPNYYCIGGFWEWKGKWVWRRHEWVIPEVQHWHRLEHLVQILLMWQTFGLERTVEQPPGTIFGYLSYY